MHVNVDRTPKIPDSLLKKIHPEDKYVTHDQ